MAVTSDDVTWCYRSLLSREPESADAVQGFVHSTDDFRSLVLRFVSSPEYQGRDVGAGLVPLLQGKMDVEVTASAGELVKLQNRTRATWTDLGEKRPHHSVLTADEYVAEAMNEQSIEQFYKSGEIEAATIDAILGRHAFSPKKTGTCVEYGCGLGRVTFPLARRFGKVVGYDISPKHIALAEQRALDLGVRNVRFQLCAVEVGYQDIEPCDFFYSCIVFQHNPPPVMRALINSALRSLKPGGMAIFQVPTYCAGYTFKLRDYLASPLHSDIEMHCISQPTVFALIADAACQVLEVREDDWVGSRGTWISNTFVVRR